MELVKSFLHSCLKSLKDDKALSEIHALIDRYGQSIPIIVARPANDYVTTNRAVHQIKKYIRTNKEMRLNVQIGDYEMGEVILDLGSGVNVLTKQTWELI